MSLLEYAPTDKSMELVSLKDSKGNDVLWRSWQAEAIDLIIAKCTADQFLKIMTKKIFGEDKELVVLEKQDPYNALMNIKEYCKNKKFQIKISIEDQQNKSLLIAM
jgi:hypothetical protein